MSSIPSSSAFSRTRSLRKLTKSERGGAINGETGNISSSRLPVKGQLTETASAPTATRTSRSATADATTARSSDLLSGVFARITSSSTRSRETGSPTPETSPPGRLTRAATVRQPSTSTRPTTSGGGTVAGPRPTTSSGAPTARRVFSGASVGQATDKAPGPRHARAKSSVTTLSSATTLRPPSQTSTASSSITATAAAPKPAPSTTNTGNNTGILKPAFKTHQQSYTPLKPSAPKPPTSLFLAPLSPSKQPTNIALSAETARLQTELLQLHLLHRDAGRVVDEWKASARGKLEEKFERVRQLDEEIGKLEGEVEEGRNIAFIVDWASNVGTKLLLLEEKVVMLDSVVSGVWSVVGEPGGRYERVAREFGEWVARVEGRGIGDEAAALELIPPLPPTWHEEAAHLARRLDDWRRKLRELGHLPTSAPDNTDGDGEAEPGPSLARILAGCRALVHGMLAELDMMEQMQRDAAAAEMRWVREMNRHGLRGTDEGPARAGAIWRVL
ncbi:hypothetical protein N657DRAFT_573206 [Parathielavia appendiculata]|uniref:Uncharacterized protein n=1 Tax=Parathielavia appendiculata TaxID=2587402 RepID=A0AAN6Z4D8_9PEZI|nr:hypothetical protein N657DRAFT_573206 [Parathielavia appendiculata]